MDNIVYREQSNTIKHKTLTGGIRRMVDYSKPTEELTEEEQWEIIEEMTCNMDPEEREEWLESWGD